MKCILIVDDSPVVRQSLRTLLEEQSGWMVCGEAENGREAVDRAEQLRPDLVVLDLCMPVMNGLEAARELKRRMPTVPLLMWTTFSSPLLEQEALKAGVSTVRSKMDAPTLLVSTIQKLLLVA